MLLWALTGILQASRADAWARAEAKVAEQEAARQAIRAANPPCTPGRDGCWTGGFGTPAADGWPSSDWQSSDWQTSSYMGDVG